MARQSRGRQWPHKIRPVPVKEMRVPPVGISQRRFSRAQAQEYAEDFDLNKFGIPAVNHRDGYYWIVDGQHRVAALKIFFGDSDPGEIECNVYEGLSDAEMAELFDGLNTRRAVNQFDQFLVRCTAGRKRECDIRRIVESNHLKIGQGKGAPSADHTIGAVQSLGWVYDRYGDVVLGKVLRVAKNAYAGDPLGFDSQILKGLGLVFNRYDGKVDEKEMATKLAAAAHGPRGLLRRAESLRERMGQGKPQCVAATVVETYNRGEGPRAKARLPGWWKGGEAE